MAMQHRNAGRQVRRGELYNARQTRRTHSWACFVLIAVIFAGSVMQLWQLANLMGQNKRIAKETAYVRELRDQVRNAENLLLQHTNISVLRREAAKLGMAEADAETQFRRVSVTLTERNSDTNAQTAYGGGDQ